MTDDTIDTDNIYPINKPKYPDLSGSPEEVWNQCLETDEEGNNIHVFGPYEYSVFVTIPLRWVLPLDDDADDDSYWNKIWNWYDNGGDGDVAAYLATKDISSFNPKKPPTRTEAFWAIVNSNMAPEQGELADVLDALDNPKVVTLKQIVDKADHFGDLKPWLEDRHNRRTIPHRMETCGYVPVRNPYAKDDGLWVLNKKRQAVYAKRELSIADQITAVRELMKELEGYVPADAEASDGAGMDRELFNLLKSAPGGGLSRAPADNVRPFRKRQQ